MPTFVSQLPSLTSIQSFSPLNNDKRPQVVNIALLNLLILVIELDSQILNQVELGNQYFKLGNDKLWMNFLRQKRSGGDP